MPNNQPDNATQAPYVVYSCKIKKDGFYPAFSAGNLEQLTGYTPEEVYDDPNWWPSHLHPEDKERVFASLTDLVNKKAHTHEYRIRHKNGSYVWIYDRLRVVHDDNGKPFEIIGIWLNITEFKNSI